MNSNQSFIGAYSRHRRGQVAKPHVASTSTGQPRESRPDQQITSEPIDASVRIDHAIDAIESLEQLLSQSVSVSDTYTAPSEIWIAQPEGQVIRLDRPAIAEPTSRPVSPKPPEPVASPEPVALAESPVPTEPVPSEPFSTFESIGNPPQETTIETFKNDFEPPVAEAAAVLETSQPPAPRWAGATWEVDAFDIPKSVAELFFDEEFFRSIAQHMGQSVREGLRSVLVTSVSSGEGRSTVAIGTAIAAAATGCRVALVDVDLQTANQHELLRLEVESDWLATIRQSEPLENAAIASLEDGLTLLPLLLAQTRSMPVTAMDIDRLIQRLEGCFDLVIFDGPVVNSWATSRIASEVDSSLIIRDARSTSQSDVAMAAQRLRTQGVRGIGVVDNFCN